MWLFSIVSSGENKSIMMNLFTLSTLLVLSAAVSSTPVPLTDKPTKLDYRNFIKAPNPANYSLIEGFDVKGGYAHYKFDFYKYSGPKSDHEHIELDCEEKCNSDKDCTGFLLNETRENVGSDYSNFLGVGCWTKHSFEGEGIESNEKFRKDNVADNELVFYTVL